MKQRARYVIALAMAFTLLATGTAIAHPDREGVQKDDFPGEGVIDEGDKNHEGEGGHLPPVQDDVNLVGKAEVTNPSGAGNDGRITDVFPYDHPELADGEQSYAYLGAFIEPTCEATGVHVMDINDLENPFEVEESFIPTSPGSYVGEGVQVIRIGDQDVLIHQNETCASQLPPGTPTGGISLHDVTDPLNPETITVHRGDTTSDPDNPDDVIAPGSARTVHSFYAWNDEATGATYAVLVDNEEFTDVDILDISDPANPVLINDTLDLVELFGVDQESPDNLTQIFSHDFDVQRAADGRYIMNVNYWDGGYVLLDVTDPTDGNVTLIQETDFEELDPERLARGQEISPEGNGHQSEMSPDLEYLIGTDEDFAPFRQISTLDDGTVFPSGNGSGTPQVTPDEPFTAENVAFLGGEGCDTDVAVTPLPTSADTGSSVGLLERGTCTFTEKIANITDAGYSAAVIVNNDVAGNCTGVLNMSADGTIPSFFIGRDTGFALFGEPYDDAACQAGTQAFPADSGEVSTQGFSVESIFEGWGYVRLYDIDINATDENRIVDETVDTYAVPESQDQEFAEGFGDLSVHEVAIDPNRIPTADEPGLAYISYYSAGFRVVEYGPDGIEEVGSFIDTEGSNLWGVEVYERDGETFVLASDRDFGLYVFDFIGDDPAEPIDPIDPAPMDPETDTVTRVAGDSRIDTAIAVSQEFFETVTAGAVVLARDDIFPDSLSGSPLAIEEDAPLLLTGSGELDDRTADEIDRVLTPETGTAETATVYLLGGEDALSAQVEDDVEALGYDVVRYGGRSRFETAAIIADDGLDNPDTVLLADGNDFPDAVSAGAAGGVAEAAVLLTGSESPSDDTDAYLAAESVTTFAVGGPAAAAYPDAEPLVGETRFETSVLVAETFFENPTVAGVATGQDFADALAGGAAVGREGGPLLLTGQDALPDSTEGYLTDNAESIDEAFVFGGTDVISEDVVEEIREAIADEETGGADELQAPPT